MRFVRSLLKLTRLDSSLLVSLTIFIPVFARTKDLLPSLSKSVPLLFIGICTFVSNDLDDFEKDLINHPDRPLPSGHIKPPLAAGIYFFFLALTLFTTKLYIQAGTVFWYYLLLALSISYGYVVDCFPGFKSLYVSCTISIPVLIVAAFYPTEGRLYLVAVALFFVVLGRELCMDFVDRAGDAVSFMHRIDERPLAVAAFSSQAIGLLLLVGQAAEPLDVLVIILMASLLALAGRYWFKLASHKKAIALMKGQLFVGLYFLSKPP